MSSERKFVKANLKNGSEVKFWIDRYELAKPILTEGSMLAKEGDRVMYAIDSRGLCWIGSGNDQEVSLESCSRSYLWNAAYSGEGRNFLERQFLYVGYSLYREKESSLMAPVGSAVDRFLGLVVDMRERPYYSFIAEYRYPTFPLRRTGRLSRSVSKQGMIYAIDRDGVVWSNGKRRIGALEEVSVEELLSYAEDVGGEETVKKSLALEEREPGWMAKAIEAGWSPPRSGRDLLGSLAGKNICGS